MDNRKYMPVPVQRDDQLPATRPSSMPALPSSGGGIAFSRRQRQEMDARFNRALADNLRSQADAYKAAGEFSDARFELAVTLSRWNTLPAVVEHMERKGFMERTNELEVLAVELETRLIHAMTSRDEAKVAWQAVQPQPPAPPAPAPTSQALLPVGLTSKEVLDALHLLPELAKPELLQQIAYILDGRLHEKEKAR